jgi:hypothetical protein
MSSLLHHFRLSSKETPQFYFKVRVILRPAIHRQSVRLGDKPPLRLTTSNFIFRLNTCGYSPYVTSSLTKGRVCRLQLLLVLASAVILKSESRVTHDHILLSHIRDTPILEDQVSVFIYPRNSVTRLYPQALKDFKITHFQLREIKLTALVVILCTCLCSAFK